MTSEKRQGYGDEGPGDRRFEFILCQAEFPLNIQKEVLWSVSYE